jgi:hypothetical protein
MATAGQTGAFAGILRHVGRTSGTVYETPLGIEPTEDGFVIVLVYEGETWTVDKPEVVPIETCDLATADVRLQRLFATKSALRLHKAGPAH